MMVHELVTFTLSGVAGFFVGLVVYLALSWIDARGTVGSICPLRETGLSDEEIEKMYRDHGGEQ